MLHTHIHIGSRTDKRGWRRSECSDEGSGVGGFGALLRREHSLARELYCDHRYTLQRHAVVGTRIDLEKTGEKRRAPLKKETGGTTEAR